MTIGSSTLLADSDGSKRRSHSPFLGFDNIWASLEVFNLIDRDNTISIASVRVSRTETANMILMLVRETHQGNGFRSFKK